MDDSVLVSNYDVETHDDVYLELGEKLTHVTFLVFHMRMAMRKIKNTD